MNHSDNVTTRKCIRVPITPHLSVCFSWLARCAELRLLQATGNMALRLYKDDKQDDDDMFTQQLRACDKALNEFECIKRKARCALLHWEISWEILRQATATGETVFRSDWVLLAAIQFSSRETFEFESGFCYAGPLDRGYSNAKRKPLSILLSSLCM